LLVLGYVPVQQINELGLRLSAPRPRLLTEEPLDPFRQYRLYLFAERQPEVVLPKVDDRAAEQPDLGKEGLELLLDTFVQGATVIELYDVVIPKYF